MSHRRSLTARRASRGWAVAACCLVVQGCASQGQSVLQTIRIETPGCAQASCEATNDRGSWRLEPTPGTVTVTTSREPLKVVCRAAEGTEGIAGSPSTLTPSDATGAATGAVAGGVAGGAAMAAALGPVGLTFIPVLGAVALLTGVAAGALAGTAAGTVVDSSKAQRAFAYPGTISVALFCPGAATTEASTGTAPYGVAVRGLAPAEGRVLGLGERGAVLVTAVAEGGRAYASGLRSGDIILAADGTQIRDAAALEERVFGLKSGASLALSVWRNGQTVELTLTLAEATP